MLALLLNTLLVAGALAVNAMSDHGLLGPGTSEWKIRRMAVPDLAPFIDYVEQSTNG